MLVYNIVSRVSEDREYFVPLISCIGDIKGEIGNHIQLNVIGEIYNPYIYNNLKNLAADRGVTENIYYTEKSVRFADIEAEMLKGYFINFSVGTFVGYSTIEAIGIGLKTIIINVDPDINEELKEVSYCNTIKDFYKLAVKMHSNEEAIRAQIVQENLHKKNGFFLNEKDKEFLLGIF